MPKSPRILSSGLSGSTAQLPAIQHPGGKGPSLKVRRFVDLPIGVVWWSWKYIGHFWACYVFFGKGVILWFLDDLGEKGATYSLNAFCFWHLNDFYVLAPDALDEGNLASNSSLHLLCKCVNPMVAGSILSQMYRDNLCFCPCLPHLFPNRSKQIFAEGVGFNDVCSLLFPPWSKLKMYVQSAITHHWGITPFLTQNWGINLELNQKTGTKSGFHWQVQVVKSCKIYGGIYPATGVKVRSTLGRLRFFSWERRSSRCHWLGDIMKHPFRRIAIPCVGFYVYIYIRMYIYIIYMSIYQTGVHIIYYA